MTIDHVLEQMEDDELFNLALFAWGVPAQVDTLIEEMAELIKALMKMRRHLKRYSLQAATYQAKENDILDECGDTQLLLNQIIGYYTGFSQEGFQEYYNASKDKLRAKLALNPAVQTLLLTGRDPKPALIEDRLTNKRGKQAEEDTLEELPIPEATTYERDDKGKPFVPGTLSKQIIEGHEEEE